MRDWCERREQRQVTAVSLFIDYPPLLSFPTPACPSSIFRAAVSVAVFTLALGFDFSEPPPYPSLRHS